MTNVEIANSHLEIGSVGAGLVGGFNNTNKFRFIKYQETISGPDGDGWKEEIINDHTKLLKNLVFGAVDKNTLQPDTKPTDNT